MSAGKPLTRSTAAGIVSFAGVFLGSVTVLVTPLHAADDDVSNEYRVRVSPHHNIHGRLRAFSHLEYRNNPEEDYQVMDIGWPGLNYSVKDWLQLSGGLLTRYTDDEHRADRLELRPFAGVKLFLPNRAKLNLYNLTQYEFRNLEDLDTHEWTEIHRLRSRFGVEFPLTTRARAWQPKTWYGMAEVEPFYRFDDDKIDPFRVRGGLGHILSDSVRVELSYYANFTRPDGGSLKHTGNFFQLNFKVGLNRGVLNRLLNPGQAD